jgi:hypothetical protein
MLKKKSLTSITHATVADIFNFDPVDSFIQRVNYSIGEYTVHRTKTKRKCKNCKHTIDFGERYAVKISLGKGKEHERPRVYAQEVLCLYCLLEKVSIDDEDFEAKVY